MGIPSLPSCFAQRVVLSDRRLRYAGLGQQSGELAVEQILKVVFAGQLRLRSVDRLYAPASERWALASREQPIAESAQHENH